MNNPIAAPGVLRIELSPDIAKAMDAFAVDQIQQSTSPSVPEEVLLLILRDWLIGHGYLELPPDREDAN